MLDSLKDPNQARAFLKGKGRRLLRPAAPRNQVIDLPAFPTKDELLHPDRTYCLWFCNPKYRLRVRKDQSTLTVTEWSRFIDAINTLHESGIPTPTYSDYVELHVQAFSTQGAAWAAHGANLLSWHREYLWSIENRLRLVNPLVTIPYWNWGAFTSLPSQLSAPSDLAAWGVTRAPGAMIPSLPSPTQITNTLGQPDFSSFQRALNAIHGQVHIWVGGDMATGGSPADPVFWLHHAMVDKLWADWQRANPGSSFDPPNIAETLMPAPLISHTVGQVVSTKTLRYVYL
ncbi:MAG: tyrosinase family protein [Acidobacteriota bacterium]